AELFEQLIAHLPAVGGAIRLKLSLIGAPELAGRDVVAGDPRDRIAGRGVGAGPAEEVRDVENHERQANETEAPFEPVPVPAHPVEHGHVRTFGNYDRMT